MPQRTAMTRDAMPSAQKLQKAGPDHPCKRMRLGGRQNNMPEEFCMASTCVLASAPPTVLKSRPSSADASPPSSSRPVAARAGGPAADERMRAVHFPSASLIARCASLPTRDRETDSANATGGS